MIGSSVINTIVSTAVNHDILFETLILIIPIVERRPSTILLLEPDDDARPLLVGNLASRGYVVLMALNAQEALDRATHAPTIDLILINQFDASIEAAIATGQRIRQQSHLSDATPVVVLAEEYTTEMEGKNVQAGNNNFVAYLEDGQQLIDLLETLRERSP